MTTARKTAHTVINTTRVYGQHSFSSVNIFTAISGTAGTMHSVAIACISNQISLQSHILLQLIRSNVSNGRPQFQRNRSGPDSACGLRISSGWPKGRETARRPAPRAVFERLTQRHQQQQLSAQTNVLPPLLWMGVRAVTTAVVSQTTRHESAAEGCCGIQLVNYKKLLEFVK